MEKDYKRLFSGMENIKSSPTLKPRIMMRIMKEETSSYSLSMILFRMVSITSLLALIPSLEYTISALRASGFYEYLSIALYDGGLAISFWKELALSIAESLPIYGFIFILSTLFVSLFSFIMSNKNTRVRPSYQFN